MSEHQRQLSLVYEAMTGMVNTATNPMQLESYQSYLLNTLQSSQDFYLIIAHILTSDNLPVNQGNDGIRILALSLLHSWIKVWWMQITSIEQHAQIRGFCTQLLLNAHTQPYISSSYYNKLGNIIADIAERQFPQHWPSFMDELLHIWIHGTDPGVSLSNPNIGGSQSSLAIQEICMKTILTIYDDCVDVDFSSHLPSTRRQEIIAGLLCYQKQLLILLYQYMISNFRDYHAAMSIHDSLASSSPKRSLLLAFKTLQSMSNVIFIDEFLTADCDFITILKQFLSYEDLQLESIILLDNLFKNGCKDTVKLRHIIITLASTDSMIAVPSEFNDLLTFLSIYATALVNLLHNNIQEILLQNFSEAQTLYLNLLQSLKSPSYRVAGNVLTGLHKVSLFSPLIVKGVVSKPACFYCC